MGMTTHREETSPFVDRMLENYQKLKEEYAEMQARLKQAEIQTAIYQQLQKDHPELSNLYAAAQKRVEDAKSAALKEKPESPPK